MEPSEVLTLEDIREGIAVSTEYRRLVIWRGVKLGSFMAGCGILVSAIAYLHGAPVTVWMFLLTAFLVLTMLPFSVREVLHFSRMAAEFKNAERKALAGELVQAADIPSLGRRVAV